MSRLDETQITTRATTFSFDGLTLAKGSARMNERPDGVSVQFETVDGATILVPAKEHSLYLNGDDGNTPFASVDALRDFYSEFMTASGADGSVLTYSGVAGPEGFTFMVPAGRQLHSISMVTDGGTESVNVGTTPESQDLAEAAIVRDTDSVVLLNKTYRDTPQAIYVSNIVSSQVTYRVVIL